MNELMEAPAQTTAIQTVPNSTTPSDLLRLAVEQGADMAKLEKLMDMQERWEANEARKAFVAAMAEFKKHAPTIIKDKNVSFKGTTYNHATLGGICEVVIAALAEQGLSHEWDTVQPDSGMIEVTCILTHMLGHLKKTKMVAPPDNSGSKNVIQQIASTVTYLQRYTLLAACGLATNEMVDDDGRGSSVQAEKEIIKQPLGAKGFDKALAAVRAKDYTVAEIRKHHVLTEDQAIALADVEKEMK